MIDFDPGDDLALLVETARKFAAEALRPRLRDAESARAVEPSVRESFDAIGLAGLEWPEDADGAGLGPLARVLVNEELAAADAGASLALDAAGPALYAVLEVDDAEVTNALREAVASPGTRVAFLDATTDRVAVNGQHIDADAAWVPADRVDLVVALVGDEVVLAREGIETTALRGAGLRAAGACALHLAAAPIVARASRPGCGERVRARARVYAASLLLGVLRDACDFSRNYAQERQAFGRPIAHHQALAFLITDMQMALDGARLLVHEAAWHLETGRDATEVAAAAFAQCIEASRLIGPNGVQILGGHGFMADYPMEKAMRESRALGLWLGGFDAAIDDAGRALCESEGPALEFA